MIPCANCQEPTRVAAVVVAGNLEAVIWGCRACKLAGLAAVMCSPGCFYEHAAEHEPPVSHWDSQPEQEIGGGR